MPVFRDVELTNDRINSEFTVCSVMSDSLQPLCAVAHQASLTRRFSRQEYWSGLPFPSPGDLPNPGIEPLSPALQAGSLPLSHQVYYKAYPLLNGTSS